MRMDISDMADKLESMGQRADAAEIGRAHV